MTRLEELFRKQERWAELASLLEKRTTGALAALPTGQQPRRQRMQELAELYDAPPGAALRGHRHLRALRRQRRRGRARRRPPGGGARGLRRARGAGPPVRPGGHVAQGGRGPASGRSSWARTASGCAPCAGASARWRSASWGSPTRRSPPTRPSSRRLPHDLEALAALDRLLEAQGRYEPLQEILRRRAELAEGPEKGSSSGGGPASWRSGWATPTRRPPACARWGPRRCATRRPPAALLRNLGRAGLAHEALRVLDQRIEFLVKDGRPGRQVAALHLEVAALRLDRLDDVAGARRSIEAALALHPDTRARWGRWPGCTCGRTTSPPTPGPGPARRRRCRGGPEAAEAWLEAGRVYRDQLGRPRRGAALLRAGLAADPTTPRRCAALAALLAAEGQLGGGARAVRAAAGAGGGARGQGGGADRSGPQPVGKAGRRRGGRPPGRGAGAGPRLPARRGHHGRHLLPRAAVVGGRAAPAAGHPAHEGPARRDGPAVPPPGRGLRQARPPRRGLPPPAGGRAHDAGPAAHPAGAGREPLPGQEVARGDRLPGGAGRARRRPQVPAGGGRGPGPRRRGRGAPQAPRARGGAVPGGPAPGPRSPAVAAGAGRAGAGAGRADRGRPATCGGWPRARAIGPSGPACSSSWATCCQSGGRRRGGLQGLRRRAGPARPPDREPHAAAGQGAGPAAGGRARPRTPPSRPSAC